MSSINKRRLVLFILLLLLSMLLLQIIRNYSKPVAVDNNLVAVDANVLSSLTGMNNMVMGSIDAYETIIQRPLFAISRSNIVEESKAVEKESNKPPPLVLIGVVLTPETKSALFREAASNEILSIKSSDYFQGWKLTEIENNRVVFLKDERTHEILLQQQDSQKSLTRSQPRRK